MSYLKALVAALAVLAIACGPSTQPVEVTVVDDIVKAAPDRAQLLLENEHVAVTRFALPPQSELPMHKGADRVVYSLTDYKLQFREEQGEPVVRNFRPGEVHWHPSGAHTVRNVGPINAEFLVVTRKSPNPTSGVTSNLAEVAPDSAHVVFENQDCKVIEVSLKPGEKQPMHNGAARVVYSATPATLKYTGGKSSAEVHAAGDVHYHLGGEHQVANASKEPVRYVIFELM
jgi:quercetin dioxygenase-like cupin family protein